jgi:molybdopterin synthase sulfur carrier subunit
MVRVELTRHLFQFFPDLEGRELLVEARDVAEVVRELETVAPGIGFYLCDERGRLRRHVNVFVDGAMVMDRARLTDTVEPNGRVLIMQALSGG